MQMYRHIDIDGKELALPVGKVMCVGRNYADHIAEMNSLVKPEDDAMLFMKPASALVDVTLPFSIPDGQGECHNELELAILISKPLTQATTEQAQDAIWGVALGLDLTLREVQAKLKQRGHPWERAKSFDGSCPITGFVPIKRVAQLQNLDMQLVVNGNVRQAGNTGMMIRDTLALMVEISQTFTLLPGDIVLTGTPAGVGPLNHGDELHLSLGTLIEIDATVASKQG